MIKHIVLLNWKDDVSQQTIDTVTLEFGKLKDTIDEIQSYEYGPDAGIFKGNADYALVAEFKSEQDLKAYARHPRHQEFLADVAGPLLESFQSVQFVMD